MTGDCHVRFCERLGGKNPPCLLGGELLQHCLESFKIIVKIGFNKNTISIFGRMPKNLVIIMPISQKPSSDSSPTKKQLIVIYFLTTTLFIGTLVKVGRDRHWWLPGTEIVSELKPEDIKVKLDINSAPWYELVLLPKLGEVKAKAIVAYREKHGDFKTLDELSNVKGIGASIIEAIRDHIKIGSGTAGAGSGNQE